MTPPQTKARAVSCSDAVALEIGDRAEARCPARSAAFVRRAVLFGVLLWLAMGGIPNGLAQPAQSKSVTPGKLLDSAIPHRTQDGGYVSSETCQSCHSDQYESWHKSFHRTMTQSASPETVLGDFNNVTLRVDGEDFRLERRGSEYWVELVDPDWKHDQAKARAGVAGYVLADPESAPRVWKRIGMLTGSHNFQAYWIPSQFGNAQFAFQFAWLIPEKRWVPRKDTFIRDPSLPSPIQSWNLNCIQCHVTAGKPGHDPETKVIHSTVGELGIGCESCHGPAERHVTWGLERKKDPSTKPVSEAKVRLEEFIVQPKKLQAKAQTEVCGQCHSMKWTLDLAQWRQHGHPFRPGADLTNSAPLIRPADFANQPWLPEPLKQDHEFLAGAFWPDGMIRVTGREYNGLAETACHTKGNMTCLSCHSIHESSPVNQLAASMDGNQACLKCHEPMRAKLTAHTHHAEGSSGSLCYNCHMPYATYGLLKSVRNHYIDSPDVATTLKTGRPNACNLCHLDQSLGWSAQHLNSWYGKPMPVEMSEQDRSVSAAVVMMLKGDAAQRALMAAGAGWAPARAVSGENWISFYLSQMLDDPYSAVRLIASRSLKKNPAFETLSYDYVGSAAERTAVRRQALERWAQLPIDRTGTNVLLGSSGRPLGGAIQKLLTARDRKRVELIE